MRNCVFAVLPNEEPTEAQILKQLSYMKLLNFNEGHNVRIDCFHSSPAIKHF